MDSLAAFESSRFVITEQQSSRRPPFALPIPVSFSSLSKCTVQEDNFTMDRHKLIVTCATDAGVSGN